MNLKSKIKRKEVKNYWETRSPGLKHSDKEVGSKEFNDDIEYERYNDFFKYKYLTDIAEFDKHKGKKILEVGVGLGTDSLQYAKNGTICSGIDLTERAIELTTKRFKQNNLKGNFVSASFTDIPFNDNTFDIVYSFGVLHHSEETQEGIDEIHRVLKPGGKIIIMLYFKGFKYYIRKLFLYGVLNGEYLKYSSQEIVSRHSEDFGSCPLTKAYSRKEAKIMFKNYENVSFSVHRLDDNFKINNKWFSISKFIFSKTMYRYIENKMGWNLIIKGFKNI